MKYVLKKAIGYFVLQGLMDLWWLWCIIIMFTIGWFITPYIDRDCAADISCRIVSSIVIGSWITGLIALVVVALTLLIVPIIQDNWHEAKLSARREK